MNRIHPLRRAFAVGAVFLTLVLSAPADAVPGIHADSLTPSADHRRATGVLLQIMQRHHYNRVPLSDTLSAEIFDRYLEALDPQKSFMLASDIIEFGHLRYELDDALLSAELTPAFALFKRYLERTTDRARFAASVLEHDFDFARDEMYELDRDKAEWAGSVEELDELWRRRVKNDILTLELAGRSREEINQTLRKRYERMQRRGSQLTANDVYQLFINAYTRSIEPHTVFFSPRASENFKIQMSLSLEGIGAALQTEDEYTVVRRIIAGGPAALSEQLQIDDRIVGVGQGEDGNIVDVVSWRLDDVVALIRGPKETIVRLQVLPADATAGSPTRTISLARDKINLEEQAAKRSLLQVDSARGRLRLGVIDVPTFYLDVAARAQGLADYRSTARDVRRLLDELAVEGIDGLILDLRGNGGGALVEATELTSLFISVGPIVQIRDARGRIQLQTDTDEDVAYGGPLVVLVDRGSASASEILAGAIQDYGRGVIVGETTFGKGTVQNVVGLDQEGELGQLKFTMAQFFRVSGASTQHRGVVPDIVFPMAFDSNAQGERGLDNALPWAEVDPARYTRWASEEAAWIAAARTRHRVRMQDHAKFALLLDELESRRKASERRTVSLVRAERKREWDEHQGDRDERDELLRKAFGRGSAMPPQGDEATEVPDIVLEEAANVLGDLIELRRR